MGVYTSVSETYIQNTMELSLQPQLYTAAYNLSGILSDINGLMPRSAVKELTTYLKLASPGLLIGNVPEAPDDDSILPDMEYVSQVSINAYDNYQLIQANSSSVIAVNSYSTITSRIS